MTKSNYGLKIVEDAFYNWVVQETGGTPLFIGQKIKVSFGAIIPTTPTGSGFVKL